MPMSQQEREGIIAAVHRLTSVLERLLDDAAAPSAANTPDAARNAFIYDQLSTGKTLQVVLNAVNANEEWSPLETIQAVSAAAKRHAERHGRAWPITR